MSDMIDKELMKARKNDKVLDVKNEKLVPTSITQKQF